VGQTSFPSGGGFGGAPIQPIQKIDEPKKKDAPFAFDVFGKGAKPSAEP
jgi:hypothetical protein